MTHAANDTALTAKLVRFQQPEKNLRYLGDLSEPTLAGLFGLDPAAYRALLHGLDEEARRTADELLGDPEFAALVARLPFRPGERIAVLGESTTADRLSWRAVLRHLLPPSVALLDLSVSGLTTSQALTHLPRLGFLRPDRVLCMLGANDAQRLARTPLTPDGVLLVGRAETERNLRALRESSGLTGPEQWTWLTPSAMDHARAEAYPHFRRAGIGWSREDVDAVADLVLTLPGTAVDTRSATRPRPDGPDLHTDDGVHLSPAGQRAVLVTLVHALAT
ncbi:SGNH/GDSL hydrolase family protein [Streptomyces sp. NPDC058052]|uniref:SGNH/GDSL hydrolase family protein n=1 Tax=Streptomyces sp. NPDC058052 TaxID=3346316 RepID=UPI0036EADFDF